MSYKPFDSFCFRFPFLSYRFLDDNINYDFFQGYLSQEKLQEAIYLGSPVLHRELSKISTDPDLNSKVSREILYALKRYINRMSTRCTPFGLFAGCGIGKKGEKTNILLSNKMDRTTRLDMFYICALYDALLRVPEIKHHIVWYPNTTLYRSGKKYRYVEWKLIQNRRKYELTEMDRSIYLNKILRLAAKGAKRNTLIDSLINIRISQEVAEEFIDELIDSQLLTGDLSQSITGEDYFTRLYKLIESLGNQTQIFTPIKNIKTSLAELDKSPCGMESYEKIISMIKEIDVPYEEKYLFQVDMSNKAVTASLGKDVLDELQSTMIFLNKITSPVDKNALSEFKDAYYSRYEGREVPLMAALDPELGLGYPVRNNPNDPSPLVDNLVFPQRNEANTFVQRPFHSILHEKAIECITHKKDEIVLTDEDIKDFAIRWDDMPPTIYTMFQILRANPGDILIKLKICSGNSGANLLARFSHTNQAMHSFVKEIVDKEKELIPEAILAEIVHLPESRTGNVLCRPHLRDYEILYIANSDLPKEQLLEISDLLLSVRNGELVIRSKRLQKRIIPRLTTAHNYHNNTLAVYRFLCDMQKPVGRGGLFFSWGSFEHPFRPRVRYHNTILSPASWTFKKKEMEHLFEIKEDKMLLSKIKEWRDNFLLPQSVFMSDSDNELYINWENPFDIRSVFDIIKNRPFVNFDEFLFEPENAVIRDQKGNPYLNECIVAFFKDTGK